MQLTVIDGASAAQIICVDAPTSNFTDISGVIAQAGVAQPLSPANPARSGWWIYNPGTTPLYVNDTGDMASNTITANNGAFVIPPGAHLSSKDMGYCSTLPLSIFATTTEGYIARIW